MPKNIKDEDTHESTPLQKEVSKDWNKIYTRFLEDTDDLICKAGGSKNLKIMIVNQKGKSKDIDLSKLLLCLS